MASLVPFSLIGLIWGGTLVLSSIPFLKFGQSPSEVLRLLSMVSFPVLFCLLFPLLAGLVSLAGQSGIKRGKFPRKPFHPVYFRRRIYGLCWTQLFYFKPIYSIVLSIPIFRKAVFTLFGYRGNLEFTVYPDTWLRDLGILEIGEKTYLSNRSTIGTNICLSDDTILVDRIRIGVKGLVGHLSMLAPGVKIGDNAEVGVGCAIGIRCHIKPGASVKPSSTLNHGAVIGEGADVGTMSFVGLRAEIGPKVCLPSGSNIPAGAVILSQAEADNYYSSETESLKKHRDNIGELLHGYIKDGSATA